MVGEVLGPQANFSAKVILCKYIFHVFISDTSPQIDISSPWNLQQNWSWMVQRADLREILSCHPETSEVTRGGICKDESEAETNCSSQRVLRLTPMTEWMGRLLLIKSRHKKKKTPFSIWMRPAVLTEVPHWPLLEYYFYVLTQKNTYQKTSTQRCWSLLNHSWFFSAGWPASIDSKSKGFTLVVLVSS